MGQRDKGRGEREELWVGEGCLHYLQVSSQVARRLTDFHCLALNVLALCLRVPAGLPVHLSAAHVRAELSPLMVGVHLTESLLLLPIASSKLIENMQTNKWNHDEK